MMSSPLAGVRPVSGPDPTLGMKGLGSEHCSVCWWPQMFPGFRVCRAAAAQDAHHIFGSKNFFKGLRGKCSQELT